MQKLNIAIPQDAVWILNKLNEGGHEAYIVGGCVRDSILGRIPQDWDITTSALPEETKTIFDHTFDTGIKHGTITVVLHHENYEVTTYRIDGEYADCRHPDEVSFTKKLNEDLLRRDFTMNAIAYHPKEGFRDPFHGQEDIAAGIIRGVGEPARRFQEDALRMLRCVRFSAQLGFAIDPETWAALCANTALIQKISAERIREELQKLWLAPFANKMPLLWESGLLAQIDATLSASLIANSQTLLEEISLCPKDNILRWCIVLQHYPIGEVKGFLKGMRLDNHSLKRISLLLEELSADLPTEPYPPCLSPRRDKSRLGKNPCGRGLSFSENACPNGTGLDGTRCAARQNSRHYPCGATGYRSACARKKHKRNADSTCTCAVGRIIRRKQP